MESYAARRAAADTKRLSEIPKPMIKLLGIPFDGNSSFLKGPSLAPPLIRQMDKSGSSNCFSEFGKEIKEGVSYTDIGDLSFNDTKAESVFAHIRNTIITELQHTGKMICFGGDHSVSYPVIDAFAEKYNDLSILHLDAHADLYEDFDNNPFSHASPFARIMERGNVKALTQAGIRTLNTHQRAQADKFGVTVIEMKDFNMDFISRLKGPLYISLDLDVLDPAYAPGVSHHEPGGLSTRELIHIIHRIKADVVGADIVEYNPDRDVHKMTAMTAYKLFKEIAAKMCEQ